MTGVLAGKRGVVVGASAGIGREIAVRLVGVGADVVFAGRRTQLLDEAVAAAGGGHALTCELADPGSCALLVERAVELLGGIDLLVVAASLSGLKLLRDTTSDDWERVLRTNVIGPSLLVREALPHLPETAVVALLSSESVGQPYPGIVPYTVSKAALEELVRGWRTEHPGLRFSCVTVGATGDTDFSRDFDMELGAKLFPTWVALGKLPARLMTSRDLGAAIADTLAVAVNTPGIDVQQLTFRPPGGPHTGDTGFMLDVVAGAAARK